MIIVVFATAFAQNKPRSPEDVQRDSRVSEILTSLETNFRNARVVLKDSWYADEYRPPVVDSPVTENTFVFTPGFRVTNIDGCNLMLRNDHARTIAKLEVSTHDFVADVWVQLNRMSPNKGRRTYRYNKDPKKVRLLGAWRTNFKWRGWSSNTIVGLTLNSSEWEKPQRWQGMDVAFTFDTKEDAEQFDTAFRQAIRLCNK